MNKYDRKKNTYRSRIAPILGVPAHQPQFNVDCLICWPSTRRANPGIYAYSTRARPMHNTETKYTAIEGHRSQSTWSVKVSYAYEHNAK